MNLCVDLMMVPHVNGRHLCLCVVHYVLISVWLWIEANKMLELFLSCVSISGCGHFFESQAYLSQDWVS